MLRLEVCQKISLYQSEELVGKENSAYIEGSWKENSAHMEGSWKQDHPSIAF
jgi:hypothetical protein